jgi:putative effector of murein hydrolase
MMNELLQIPLFPVFITLSAFYIGVAVSRTVKSPLCNSILVAVIVILVFHFITGMDLKAYQEGSSRISWLLTPATVSLAVPMYEHFQILRKNTKAVLAGVAAGAISCLCMVLVFSLMLRFEPEITISLLPKSVTTAIGVPLSEMTGGIAPITTAAIIVTGISASAMGPMLCDFFHLTGDIAQGVAYGTAGHVVGTSKAMERSAVAGAASSLSLVVAGLLTAVVLPLITPYL